MKQNTLKKITGKIVVKTGLHIGAGNDKVEIGGMDNPIIRNPLTREPYIPGSSLKGKMRALLEWKLNKIDNGALDPKKFGAPCTCGKAECPICRVFGSANKTGKGDETKGPTRIIVRDAVLTEYWKKNFGEGKAIVEEKSENSLNRITAAATPRPIERIVPGVEFDFELAYRIIDTGDDGKKDLELFNEVVLQGLKMLQEDYLGGGGTRGNGQIEFKDLKDENNNDITL